MRSHLQDKISPEMRYACRHWATHMSETDEPDQRLMDKLLDFLKRSFLLWLEVMSVLGEIRTAESCVRYAQTWYSKVCQ